MSDITKEQFQQKIENCYTDYYNQWMQLSATELIQKAEEKKALETAIRLLESGKLTDVQKRRFCLHFFQGLSTRQIAKLEGVHQRAVWDSLMWAEKKLKKFYEE